MIDTARLTVIVCLTIGRLISLMVSVDVKHHVYLRGTEPRSIMGHVDHNNINNNNKYMR